MLNRNWIKEDKKEYKPWFTACDSFDGMASGSSSLGQLTDLYLSSTAAEWPASNRPVVIRPIEIHSVEVNAGWKSAFNPAITEDIDKTLRTTAEKIEYIRDTFGISVSQLAKVIKTSRPSIYTWLEGEEPCEKFLNRIQNIFQLTERWSAMNPYHFTPGPLLRQPLGNRISLLDRLEQMEVDTSDIESGFDDVLELMRRRRERMDRSKRKTEGSNLSDLEKDKNRHALTSTIGSSE